MLNISPEKVCYIIVKAREFDVKVPPVESDPGSNPANGGEREILVDYADDSTLEELKGALGLLNEDEMIDLVALVWMGRGDFTTESWEDAVRQARETVDKTVVGYLVGIPLLGDYLEEALSQFGHSCEEYEIDRL